MYYSQKNKIQKAIRNIQKAIELGYDDLEFLKIDDSLNNIRQEPKFQQILQELKNKQ